MTQLKTLSLIFNLPLRHEDIPVFRKAVSAAFGRDNDLFHNHKLEQDEAPENESGEFIYRYPRIQYQVHEGNASIIGINEGAEALLQIKRQGSFHKVRIPGMPRDFELKITDSEYDAGFRLEVLPENEMAVYRVYGLLPFGPKNYRAYKELIYMEDKLRFLEKKLTNHVVCFAKEMKWERSEGEWLEARIIDLDRVKKLEVYGTEMMGFDLVFSLNALLPDRIGLGPKISAGFGWIYRILKEEENIRAIRRKQDEAAILKIMAPVTEQAGGL